MQVDKSSKILLRFHQGYEFETFIEVNIQEEISRKIPIKKLFVTSSFTSLRPIK